MTPSPFHGIFSAAFNEEAEGKALRKETAKKQVPEPAQPATQAQTQGQVAVDVFEYDGYYIIKAPIAGVKLSDLDIEIADSTIIIRGERKQTDTVPDNQYYVRECFWGPFSRSVKLPTTIDPRKVKATFNKDGVLKILVPKEEKVKIVRISE